MLLTVESRSVIFERRIHTVRSITFEISNFDISTEDVNNALRMSMTLSVVVARSATYTRARDGLMSMDFARGYNPSRRATVIGHVE